MLRIHVLGELIVETSAGPVELTGSWRARSLLAWLALNPGNHARGELAARFWPEVLDSSARASLRNGLWALRRALGDEEAEALIATRERVGLEGAPDGLDRRGGLRGALRGRQARRGARPLPRGAARRARRRVGLRASRRASAARLGAARGDGGAGRARRPRPGRVAHTQARGPGSARGGRAAGADRAPGQGGRPQRRARRLLALSRAAAKGARDIGLSRDARGGRPRYGRAPAPVEPVEDARRRSPNRNRMRAAASGFPARPSPCPGGCASAPEPRSLVARASCSSYGACGRRSAAAPAHAWRSSSARRASARPA